MKITEKLIIFCIILAVIPLLVVGIVGYNNATKVVKTEVENSMENQVKQIGLDVKTVYDIAQSKVTSDLSLAREIFYSYGEPTIDSDGNMVLIDPEKEAAVQKKVNSDIFIAHTILYGKGEIAIDNSKTITVNAINQITKESSEITIPVMTVNGKQLAFDYSIVDEIKETSGVETATLFQTIPGGILRISTNVMKLDGTRAILTYIPENSPVYKSVMDKITYKGRAYVVNAWYSTAYEPILDDAGNVIGVLYVGVKEQRHIVNDNYEIVDKVKSLVGGTATIFQIKSYEGEKENDVTSKDWSYAKAAYRISTNVQKLDGTRAVGTMVSKPVYDTIMAGESYYGRAFVVTGMYLTAYEPILDSETGEIIGILYVGVREEDFQKTIKENIAKQVIGKTGYIDIVDLQGNAVLSQERKYDGKNLYDETDADGMLYVQKKIDIASKLGPGESEVIYHNWKRQETSVPEKRVMAVSYMKEWEWVISVNAYQEEFLDDLKKFQNTIILVCILSIIFGGGLAFLFAIRITTPLKKLTQAGNRINDGEIDTQLPEIKSKDEIKDLADTMNLMVGAIKFMKSEKQNNLKKPKSSSKP